MKKLTTTVTGSVNWKQTAASKTNEKGLPQKRKTPLNDRAAALKSEYLKMQNIYIQVYN